MEDSIHLFKEVDKGYESMPESVSDSGLILDQLPIREDEISIDAGISLNERPHTRRTQWKRPVEIPVDNNFGIWSPYAVDLKDDFYGNESSEASVIDEFWQPW